MLRLFVFVILSVSMILAYPHRHHFNQFNGDPNPDFPPQHGHHHHHHHHHGVFGFFRGNHHHPHGFPPHHGDFPHHHDHNHDHQCNHHPNVPNVPNSDTNFDKNSDDATRNTNTGGEGNPPVHNQFNNFNNMHANNDWQQSPFAPNFPQPIFPVPVYGPPNFAQNSFVPHQPWNGQMPGNNPFNPNINVFNPNPNNVLPKDPLPTTESEYNTQFNGNTVQPLDPSNALNSNGNANNIATDYKPVAPAGSDDIAVSQDSISPNIYFYFYTADQATDFDQSNNANDLAKNTQPSVDGTESQTNFNFNVVPSVDLTSSYASTTPAAPIPSIAPNLYENSNQNVQPNTITTNESNADGDINDVPHGNVCSSNL